MRILTAVLMHDGRLDTIERTMDSLKDIDTDIFCYDTEKESIKMLQKHKLHIYSRPDIIPEKLTHEKMILGAGLPESQITYISWLRNKVFDKAKEEEYDYVFFVDSDLIVPKDAIDKLLKLKVDIAMGWYFNKRLQCVNLLIYGLPNMNDVMLLGEPVDTYQGGGAGLLLNKNIINDIRFDLYNGHNGEARPFCKNAILKGYKVKADPRVYFEHIGEDYTEEGRNYADQKIKEWNL